MSKADTQTDETAVEQDMTDVEEYDVADLQAKWNGGHSYIVTHDTDPLGVMVNLAEGTTEALDESAGFNAGVPEHFSRAAVRKAVMIEGPDFGTELAIETARMLVQSRGQATVAQPGSQADSSGAGDSSGGSDSDDDSDDEDFWTELTPDNEDLYDDVSERLSQMFALQPGIDGENVIITPAKVDGRVTGVVVQFAAPWKATYDAWDNSANTWKDDDAKAQYKEEQEAFRNYAKSLDVIEYEGDPHYVNYIEEGRFGEVLS